jgi:YidC/Oxa1 family membrane protein insertase
MFEFIDMIIVRPIVNLLLVIYSFVGDFGLAIIIFTVIVKLVMWPLMKRQMRQTRMMREIQPELAEIKKNCKGNRQLESMQMMDLYKRKNIKPFRSMLTLLIQLPIFIALYTAIRVMVTPPTVDLSVERSAYSFVEQLPRVQSLITDHESFHPSLFGVVDLSATAGFASVSAVIILVFALAAAVTQYLMAKQLNPSKKAEKRSFKQIMKDAAAGKQADQSEMNAVVSGQMTKFMPIMMLFIMINLPGALVFYYLLTNLVTVIQQKIILDRDYTEMEAAADKKILKELRDAEEAEVVEKPNSKVTSGASKAKNKKPKQNITRISASDKKGRRKK